MSRFIVIVVLFASALLARAENTPYRINPGDILIVYVWNEKDLAQEVLVHPDGKISEPLERKSR
jgi:protein involved in polysaccharide export with SLBB domain